MAYKAGLRKPTVGLPALTACSLTNAVNPAQSGAAQLVPPKYPELPLSYTTYTASAVSATSGMLRFVELPWLEAMLTGACHEGIE